MRSVAVVACVLFALTAGAETFGPLIVETKHGVGVYRDGNYFEHRFSALNPTGEPHEVRIEVGGTGVYNGANAHASRTVTVAPRSGVLISIPQYVATEYGGFETRISVDGKYEGQLPGTVPSGGYRAGREVLLGRNITAETALLLAPEDSGVGAVRPSVAPQSWSANWLHYSAFSAIALTPADYNELSRPVQTALLRWVAGGGALLIVGGELEGLPPLRIGTAADVYRSGHHGFGTIGLVPEKFDPANVLAVMHEQWKPQGVENIPAYGNYEQRATPIPLVDDELPVKSLFSLLILFAVVGGPVNIWVLAKKERRLWIFWTLPLLALATAAVLVSSVIVSEGWVRVQKSSSMTLLDERIGEAVTLGWTGFYSTLAPDGQIRFDSASEVRPLFGMSEGRTDWTDGQRFVSGWVGSRLARGFAFRKIEPRRERLPVRREAGQLIAVNGLGASIAELWVADENGNVFTAKNVAAGKEVALAPSKMQVSAGTDPAHLYAAPSQWATYYKRLAENPQTVLRPNSWIAVVQRSPFVDGALAKATRSSSDGVVIGVMKGIENAG